MSERDELTKTLVNIPWRSNSADVVAEKLLAAGYRKPPTIDNEKLVIDDGMLLLEVGECTCTPYGSSHEAFCSYEYLDDLTWPLERAGYVKVSEAAIERAAKAMLDAMYDDKTLKVDDEDRSIIRAVVAALREGA